MHGWLSCVNTCRLCYYYYLVTQYRQLVNPDSVLGECSLGLYCKGCGQLAYFHLDFLFILYYPTLEMHTLRGLVEIYVGVA